MPQLFAYCGMRTSPCQVYRAIVSHPNTISRSTFVIDLNFCIAACHFCESMNFDFDGLVVSFWCINRKPGCSQPVADRLDHSKCSNTTLHTLGSILYASTPAAYQPLTEHCIPILIGQLCNAMAMRVSSIITRTAHEFSEWRNMHEAKHKEREKKMAVELTHTHFALWLWAGHIPSVWLHITSGRFILRLAASTTIILFATGARCIITLMHITSLPISDGHSTMHTIIVYRLLASLHTS